MVDESGYRTEATVYWVDETTTGVNLMSYHSRLKWTFQDKVTDEAVNEVIHGLEYHLELYDSYIPDAYICFNAVDASIHFIGQLLEKLKKDPEFDISGIVERSEGSAGELIIQVLAKIKGGRS